MRIIILGAGLQGICTAFYLAKAGHGVSVLESGPRLAMGPSSGNGGYVQAECPEVWNAPGILPVLLRAWRASLGRGASRSAMLVRTSALPGLLPWGLQFLRCARRPAYLAHTALNRELARYSQAQMADLREHYGITYSQSSRGALFLFRESQAMEAYRPLMDHLRDAGAHIEALDRDELLQSEPALIPIASKLHGAVYFPRDECGNPAEFCEELARLARSLGVEFRFGLETQSIRASAEGVRVVMKQGELRADALVIAAGVGSKSIARSLGISLPIAPAKGYSLTIPFGDFENRPSHVIADMGVHAGINPMGDSLRLAGIAEFCGRNTSISERRVNYMLSLVEEVLPEFAQAMDSSKVETFAGLRPLSADGLPMVGRTGHEQVYVNSGHGGLGFTQAAGSGRALADLIDGRVPEVDLSAFSPLRFA